MRRMILPIIKKYWKLLISIALVSALGCGLMVGLFSAYTSLETSLNRYVEEGRYPSAYVTTEVVNRSTADKLRAVEGVEAVNTRLAGDTVLLDPTGRYLSVRVFGYNEADIQRFHVWSSTDTGDRDAVMLEYNFAVDNNLQPGDELEFRVGSERRVYVVSAVVSAPETLKVEITENSWGVNPDFGYVYAPVKLLEQEDRKLYDDTKTDLDDKADQLDDAEEEANSAFREAKQKLDEAKALLDEKEAEFLDAMQEAETQRETLNATRQELLDLRDTLDATLVQLQEAQVQLQEGIPQLREAIALLQQAKSGLAQIDAALASLLETRASLADPQVTQAVAMLRSLDQTVLLDDLFREAAALREAIALLQEYGITVNENYSLYRVAIRLNTLIELVQADRDYLHSPAALALISRYVEGHDVTGDAEYPTLQVTILRYSQSQLLGENLAEAYRQAVSRNQAILDLAEDPQLQMILNSVSSDTTLGSLLNSLDQAQALVAALRANGKTVNTVGDLITAYDSSLAELDANIRSLNAQRAEIVAQLEANGVTESQLDSKLAELTQQLNEAETQLPQVVAGIQEIEDSYPQIEEGLAQIKDGLAQINELLTSGRQQLLYARKQYEESRAAYSESLSTSVTEFARLRDELERAYASLDEQEGYEALCNQFLIYITPGLDQQEVLDRAVAAFEDVAVKKSYVYLDSPVYDKIKQNLDSIETLATYMPIVFFAVVLIVVFLFMSLVIKQCRREIGILRALGFSKTSVRLLFCGVDLAVSLVAVLVGTGIGTAIMVYMGRYFQDFFPLPEYYSALDLRQLLLAAALTVSVGQAATLIGTSVISRILPSEAMTRPAPVTTKIPRVLNLLTRNAKPMLKFSASSLMRNKGRFVFSVICTAASVMMIFASLAFSTSKTHALRQLYELRIHYDCQIFYSDQPTEAELEGLRALPFVREVEPLLYYEVDVTANGRTERTALNGIDPGTAQVGIYDAREEPLTLGREGIILERHLAEKLGVGVGDSVEIEGVSFQITAISEQSLSRFQYASVDAVKPLGAGSLGSVVLDIDEADEQKLLAYLMDQENYLFSMFTRLAYQGNEKVFNTYDLASYVIVGFAILIGFTIVFNTAQTNLLEKKKELCILRTLGFPHREISSSWFIQSFLQYIFSVILGIPLGIYIAKTALVKLSNDVREFVFANGLREYAFTALLVFAYIVISHLIAMNALKKWDIVETVKEKE